MITMFVKFRNRLWILLVAAILLIQPLGAVLSQEHDELDAETLALIAQVRGETAVFREVDNATDAGYNAFLGCLFDDVEGGMGQHYVNAELVGDGMVDPLRPEALVYEPHENGSMVLVALEYIVPLPLWSEADPPELFGHTFHENVQIVAENPEANPAWILHLWIGTHNPNGILTDYNPSVFCPDEPSA